MLKQAIDDVGHIKLLCQDGHHLCCMPL
jgi:hypothetical protein